VHKGDLTGIEIINRLAEQVWARGIHRLEEHRAVELIRARGSNAIAGVLMIDMRTGEFVFVQAQAVLLATGGGPTMYRYHTPSGDKTCDGMAMALRAGLTLRDMEMVQFHPTGLIAGPHTRITGTIIEEGLRGAGGHLLNGAGERFMQQYDPRNERATRDIVSRAMFDQMRRGNVGPRGGLYLTMRHLDPAMVRREFKGMVERCEDVGFDLVSGLVDVVPTAHYMMGGVVFDTNCTTELHGFFVAGEDSGGVHGANRLGGNGVANSTVFGGIAGDVMPGWVRGEGSFLEPDTAAIESAIAGATAPFGKPAGDLNTIREQLYDLMWEDVGIIRDAASLERAAGALEALEGELDETGVDGASRPYNLSWHDWLNLKNLILVSRSIRAAATAREDSRGAHYRSDFPEVRDLENSRYTCVTWASGRFDITTRPVDFTRVRPGETLLKEGATSADADVSC
jgi:fumarate reductase flavoprotein subunit